VARAADRAPARASRLLGRGRELAAIAAALGEGRVVTVTGTAGVGKTSLAREAARAEGSSAVVDLSGARTADDARTAIRGAVAREAPPVIVVLDGCDRLGPTLAPVVEELMARGPAVRCLATSRRRLELAGERVLRVEPLGLPFGAEDVAHADASVLFAQRARDALGELPDDPRAAAAIVAICARTGGVPAAIERAARQLGAMSLLELAQDLDACIDAATEAALTLSWERLSPTEQGALARLGVFRGSFTSEVAGHLLEDVATTPTGRRMLLATLVDHGLLRRRDLADASSTAPSGEQALRDHALDHHALGEHAAFEAYPIVRAFAARRLGDAEGATRDRHASLVLSAATRGAGTPDVERSAHLPPLPDLRAALAHALAAPAEKHAAPTVLAAAVMAARALAEHGAVGERRALLDLALHRAGAGGRAGERSPTLVHAWVARADALDEAGLAAEARADRRRAAALAAELDDAGAMGAASVSLAREALDDGRVEEACERGEHVAALARARGDRHGEVLARLLVAGARRALGDCGGAREEAERAALVASAAGANEGLRRARIEIALAAHDAGDLDVAQAVFEAELAEGRGDALATSILTSLALVHVERAVVDPRGVPDEEVTRLLDRALRAHRAAGTLAGEALATGCAGLVDEIAGRRAVARARYREAAAVHADAGRPRDAGLVLSWLGRLEASEGREDEALAAFDEARGCVLAGGDRGLIATLDGCEAHLAVFAARAARASGDAERAAASAARGERALEAPAPSSAHARIARALLARAIASLARGPTPPASAVAAESAGAPPETGRAGLRVSTTARWFALAEGARVSLDTRRPLRLILRRLAEARDVEPGAPLDVPALLAAGWPGERVMHEAGIGRVYAAVSHLRGLGLREVLLRRDDGYLLDPAVVLARADD
jgi:tetratricopeptide (TPR) repeat protein